MTLILAGNNSAIITFADVILAVHTKTVDLPNLNVSAIILWYTDWV